jgi:hypothetical protein
MSARIFKPSKSATQSGSKNTKKWLLEFTPEKPNDIDPSIGWIGGDQIYPQQVKLSFKSLEDAINYAKNSDIDFEIVTPNEPKRKIKSYLDMYRRS